MANITTQTIRVDLSTGKVIPTAYTHQNDTARTLVFDMYNGGMPYTMTGNTVKFAYKTPIVNGQYSVIAGASMASGTVSGNKVTVTLPSAYTQISGVGMLTMIITPTSGTVRPVNIRLVVQKSADGDDTVAGASDFPSGLAKIANDAYETYMAEYLDAHNGAWYAGKITETGNGFISVAGAITSNSNYKYRKYYPLPGSYKLKVDSIYVPMSNSTLATFAFFDENDSLLDIIQNSEINTTVDGNTFTNVVVDIPVGTEYVYVTFGNMASSTTFSTISEKLISAPVGQKRVVNQLLSSEYQQQFYFHAKTADLDNPYSLAFNARIITSLPVVSYDIYFTGYDQDYTGRTFAAYKTGITTGIDGNEITVAENFTNIANNISNKYWNGVVINLQYSRPAQTSGTPMRIMNRYSVITEYCTLNGKDVDLAQYPSAGYYVTNEKVSNGFNPMLGGYLCAIGDSLTAVYYKSEEESWVHLIASWNSMRYDNLGITGNPMAKTSNYTDGKCMAERVDDLDPYKFYTHIFVMGGANDFNYSVPIGENTDSEITTFKGAVNHIISTLTAKYPQAKIVFATTYRRDESYLDKQYADAMMEVCALHSIPCLNNYENSGVQMFDATWMSIYGATNALGNNHLNAVGDLFVAPRFENALKYGIQ